MRRAITLSLVSCLLFIACVAVLQPDRLSQAGAFFREKLGDSSGSFRVRFPSNALTPSTGCSPDESGLPVQRVPGGRELTDDSLSVLEVQMLLWIGGYRFGDPLGSFGSSTKRALMEVQRDQGLPVTGILDDRTLKALYTVVVDKLTPRIRPPVEPPTTRKNEPPNPDPGAVVPSDQTRSDRPSAPTAGLTRLEQEMLELLNRERTTAGLAPLHVDMRLVDLARKKSRDMIDRNYFSHQSPTYGSPFDMMRAAGIEYKYAGENIAGAPTVEKAHAALMNSEGHRRNIMNRNFTRVGIGIVEGGPYGLMVTQMFTG